LLLQTLSHNISLLPVAAWEAPFNNTMFYSVFISCSLLLRNYTMLSYEYIQKNEWPASAIGTKLIQYFPLVGMYTFILVKYSIFCLWS